MSTAQLTIVAKVKGNEPRVESKLIANGLGIKHRYLVDQVDKYQDQLKGFGILRFETSKINRGRGRPERLVYLNENQCYAMVTLSKNTQKAVSLKFALVKAFAEAREAVAANEDYLPNYRETHNNVSLLVRLHGSSVPESIHHANLERMINKALGLPSGCRKQLPSAIRSAVAVAERIAGVAYERALSAGEDHKAAYQQAKAGVLRYAQTVRPILPCLEC